MKKRFLVLIILVISVVACKAENKELAQASDKRYADFTKQIAVADEGIFYIGSDKLIHFNSVDSEEDMIFCTELNCKHLPASADNPDPECRAALFTGNTKIAYYEGAIYYFVENDMRISRPRSLYLRHLQELNLLLIQMLRISLR